MDANSASNMIQTLVFMDLETTGLPHLIGSRNVQITELSFIAVDRAEFQDKDNYEDMRVLNKLNLCFMPRSVIPPDTESITGLSATSLRFQQFFNQESVQLLKLFLRKLNPPVCLLAHNGRQFDFRLLQAELFNIGEMLIDRNIKCADTIDAFRSFLPSMIPAETEQGSSSARDSIPAPKKMHYDTPVKRKMSYSLKSLYELLFGCPVPKAHSAEGDTVALMKISHLVKREFLMWVDSNFIHFGTINPLWKKM